MTPSRSKTLTLLGGGVNLAASAGLGAVAARKPRTAGLP